MKKSELRKITKEEYGSMCTKITSAGIVKELVKAIIPYEENSVKQTIYFNLIESFKGEIIVGEDGFTEKDFIGMFIKYTFPTMLEDGGNNYLKNVYEILKNK